MKIYNQDKTQELNEQDLDRSLGHFVQDKIATTHHEATEAIPAKSVAEQIVALTEQGIKVKEIGGKQYRVTRTYPNGGEDVEEIIDIPAVPAKDAYDDYEEIKVYIPYTAEELQKIADNKRHAELKAELAKIKEDIEQETFGIVRDDFEAKKARAAEIINELRVLEGKEPRTVRPSVL
ncbi:MAG: hypothetical protein K2L51_06730 [Clostridiales bacterium]|nr:hypothetical protein [Clostridiales bacterium]